ncbi:hypothetical protein MPSEU_000738100 [Mayamaea pseudoterrestris]|nr:hypothetical protein MPSEU_000738100 [Mayamaea pseudoterrestris]
MQRRTQNIYSINKDSSAALELPLQSEDSKYHSNQRSPQLICTLILIISLTCGCLIYFLLPLNAATESSHLNHHVPSLFGSEDLNAAKWPLVHIVHTRFMQEQSALQSLAWARLKLFEVFCFPTMKQQSSQRFIWILQADPNLDEAILHLLQTLLAPHSNFYLVLSNKNFRINRQFPGAWRGGAEPQELRKVNILTGNRKLLDQVMADSETKHVLETRLDADDGLHIDLLQHIQERAIHRFEEPNIRWTYWCTRRHIEWHWMDQPEYSYGVLTGIKHDKLCITPGITVGFPVGTVESDVPIFAHDKIVVTLRDMPADKGCGAKHALDCLDFIETHTFEAIRSRTPTSAGMLHVDLTRSQLEATTPFLTYMYWDTVENLFRLNRSQIKGINQYLTDHLIDIAKDNLYGQCTTGHSCKDKAKAALEELIASRQNATVAKHI